MKDTDVLHSNSSTKPFIRKLFEIGAIQLEAGNYHKAQQAYATACQIFDDLNDKQNVIRCKINLAVAYLALKDAVQALITLQSIQHIADEAPDLEADWNYNTGVAYEQLHSLVSAASSYNKALLVYKTKDADKHIVANVSLKAGLAYMKLEKFSKALAAFTSAETVFKFDQSAKNLAFVLCCETICYSELGVVDKTRTACEECSQLCASLPMDNSTYWMYSQLMLAYSTIKFWKEALEIIKILENSIMFEEEGFPILRRKAILLQNKGAVYNSLNKFSEGTECSLAAAAIFGTHGLRLNQCHAFINAAYSEAMLRHYTNCEENFILALQAAKDAGSDKDQWQVYEGLAGIASTRGEIDRAINYFQKAVRLATNNYAKPSEQDRLVTKLSSCLSRKVERLHSTSQQNTPALGHGFMSSTTSRVSSANAAKSPTPRAFYPTPEPDAVVSPSLPITLRPIGDLRNRAIGENEELYSPETNKQELDQEDIVNEDRLDPIRELHRFPSGASRRRQDFEEHAIHADMQLIHEGLEPGTGTFLGSDGVIYQAMDRVRQGNLRRHDSATTFLNITGLAVDDGPHEPNVGNIDQVDSRAPQYSVRPMSAHAPQRKSRIPLLENEMELPDLSPVESVDECSDGDSSEDELKMVSIRSSRSPPDVRSKTNTLRERNQEQTSASMRRRSSLANGDSSKPFVRRLSDNLTSRPLRANAKRFSEDSLTVEGMASQSTRLPETLLQAHTDDDGEGHEADSLVRKYQEKISRNEAENERSPGTTRSDHQRPSSTGFDFNPSLREASEPHSDDINFVTSDEDVDPLSDKMQAQGDASQAREDNLAGSSTESSVESDTTASDNNKIKNMTRQEREAFLETQHQATLKGRSVTFKSPELEQQRTRLCLIM